jgi:hypothetical protein
MAYKQTSRPYQSQPEADYYGESEPEGAEEEEIWYDTANSEYKQLTNGSWIKTTIENSEPVLTTNHINGDIKLVKKPKDGTVVVTRIHTEYGVEIPLFETNFEDSSGMSEGEYHIYESENAYFLTAYVPANIKLPIDNAGTVR